MALAEFMAILWLNSRMLVFTLDDAYIHLALAENIRHGHYGVNINEFSAPSSSILWPFLIAPFSHLSISAYIVLSINILLASGTVCVYWRILLPPISGQPDHKTINFFTLTLILIIISNNLIGLIYTGMEHSFQVFSVSLIFLGLIYEMENKKLTWWFIGATVISPLIRYECLALSLPATGFLFFRGYRAKSVTLVIFILGSLGCFSLFLLSLGLHPLPSSVLAKTPVLSSGGSFSVSYSALLVNLKEGLTRGFLLFIGLLMLVANVFFKGKKSEEKLLAGTIGCSLILHLLFGNYGWYGRYEIYIWSVTLMALLYLNKKSFYGIPNKMGFYKGAGILILSVILFCGPYIKIIVTTPLASNNTYEQQYQMHRFATDYYKKAVAVNDIGYVSYLNNNYVLDLWGLASIEALQHRFTNGNGDWISRLAEEKHVELAMIYKDFFKNIPDHWREIGELHLGKTKITPERSTVTFFALNDKAYGEIYKVATVFKQTLPQGVNFVLF
jgi:hypothetical protein